MTPFWLVWRKSGKLPRKEHATRESAENEAARLASLMPGVKFHILKSDEYVVKTKEETTK